MATSGQNGQIGPQAGPGGRRLPSSPNPTGSRTGPARDSPIPVCKLLREDPELAAAVPEPRRKDALWRCTAPVLTITAQNSGALSTIQDHPEG